MLFAAVALGAVSIFAINRLMPVHYGAFPLDLLVRCEAARQVTPRKAIRDGYEKYDIAAMLQAHENALSERIISAWPDVDTDVFWQSVHDRADVLIGEMDLTQEAELRTKRLREERRHCRDLRDRYRGVF